MDDNLAVATGTFGRTREPFAADSASRPNPRGGKGGDGGNVDGNAPDGGGGAVMGGLPGGGNMIGGVAASKT